MRKIWLSFVGLIVSALLLSGCAPSNGQTEQIPPSQPRVTFAPVASGDDIHRLIDPYLPTLDDLLAISAFRFATEQACLKSAGYPVGDVQPADYPALVAAGVSDRISRTRLYGFFDVNNYREFGYTRPLQLPGYVEIDPPEGVPSEIAKKCASAGVEAVSGVTWADLPNGGPQLAVDDPRVAAARASWSECLALARYQASDPVEFWMSHMSRSDADMTAAAADVNCKISTNFVGIAVGVQNEYDQEYIARNQVALATYATDVRSLVATANAATK